MQGRQKVCPQGVVTGSYSSFMHRMQSRSSLLSTAPLQVSRQTHQAKHAHDLQFHDPCTAQRLDDVGSDQACSRPIEHAQAWTRCLNAAPCTLCMRYGSLRPPSIQIRYHRAGCRLSLNAPGSAHVRAPAAGPGHSNPGQPSQQPACGACHLEAAAKEETCRRACCS